MSVLRDMAEMQRGADAQHVVLMPSKGPWEMTSALHVPLDLKLETRSQLPQAQTLVFVEGMLS